MQHDTVWLLLDIDWSSLKLRCKIQYRLDDIPSLRNRWECSCTRYMEQAEGSCRQECDMYHSLVVVPVEVVGTSSRNSFFVSFLQCLSSHLSFLQSKRKRHFVTLLTRMSFLTRALFVCRRPGSDNFSYFKVSYNSNTWCSLLQRKMK